MLLTFADILLLHQNCYLAINVSLLSINVIISFTASCDITFLQFPVFCFSTMYYFHFLLPQFSYKRSIKEVPRPSIKGSLLILFLPPVDQLSSIDIIGIAVGSFIERNCVLLFENEKALQFQFQITHDINSCAPLCHTVRKLQNVISVSSCIAVVLVSFHCLPATQLLA